MKLSKSSSPTRLLALLSIMSLCTPALSSQRCTLVFETAAEPALWQQIQREIFPGDAETIFDDNLSYLRTLKSQSSAGVMRSKFSDIFQTRFYYSSTGVPQNQSQTLEAPLVDSSAKVVFIFVHGSGTAKSSGRNFQQLMNTLSQMGYAGVAFDLPFHMEGPRRHDMHDAKKFISWFSSIVDTIKSQTTGQPVYLVGHSFGPEVISEYLMQNPFSVQGAALLSPAGFDPILEKWQSEKTEKMKFGGDVASNTNAGEWAAQVVRGFSWNKTQGQHDPTRANPNLKVRMLSGDREEYVPAPLGANGLPAGKNTYDIAAALKKHLQNITATIEPGIGHYVFEHKDQQNQNVVLRELLALVDSSPADFNQAASARAVELQSRTLANTLAQKYASDGLFRSWISVKYSVRSLRQAVRNNDERLLKKIELEYSDAKLNRENELMAAALKLADEDLTFYNMNPTLIDNLRKPGAKPNTALFSLYLDYLERN